MHRQSKKLFIKHASNEADSYRIKFEMDELYTRYFSRQTCGMTMSNAQWLFAIVCLVKSHFRMAFAKGKLSFMSQLVCTSFQRQREWFFPSTVDIPDFVKSKGLSS
ncbi:hypothetical protein NPIL_395041 [Nephila pilipes]|uniref:Uncharacterized protein n=1 Tax=Nephila pilipes TaxID=299642 RepID=A0A8X6NC92_NEPPI|nr:hypothetical protein NPIL_395041 [Nephila pilipes]